jgi:hypothetical protein
MNLFENIVRHNDGWFHRILSTRFTSAAQHSTDTPLTEPRPTEFYHIVLYQDVVSWKGLLQPDLGGKADFLVPHEVLHSTKHHLNVPHTGSYCSTWRRVLSLSSNLWNGSAMNSAGCHSACTGAKSVPSTEDRLRTAFTTSLNDTSDSIYCLWHCNIFVGCRIMFSKTDCGHARASRIV